MVTVLAPKPQFPLDFPGQPAPRFPLGRPPLRLVPPPPEAPPSMPGTGFGRMFGGIGFTISALWAGKAAYDAVKAVPSQLPWMPGPNVAPEIWSDPKRVIVEAHARFGQMDTPYLNQLHFIREKQAMPRPHDPTFDPNDRNLMVQDESGEWKQVPLEGQETGALVIGDLWEHGVHLYRPLHERADDEKRLIEVELGQRNPQLKEPKKDTDKSWMEQYADYIQELADAMRRRANGEDVPLPILVINLPEETKMKPQSRPQVMCSAANASPTSVNETPAPDVTNESPAADADPTPNKSIAGNSEPFSKTGDIRDIKTVLFVVAMDVEFNAIQETLKGWEEVEPPFGVDKLLKHEDGNRTYYLTKSGVGTVNAALTVDAVMQNHSPDAIILLGVGGSLDPKVDIGDIVVGTSVVQHDSIYVGPDGVALMRPGALFLTRAQGDGFSPHLMPFEPLTSLIIGAMSTYGQELTHHTGTILTGNQFIATTEAKQRIASLADNSLLVEMESGGIALACERRKVPFAVAKTVSDRFSVEHGISNDYKKFLASSASNSANIVNRIILFLSEEQK